MKVHVNNLKDEEKIIIYDSKNKSVMIVEKPEFIKMVYDEFEEFDDTDKFYLYEENKAITINNNDIYQAIAKIIPSMSLKGISEFVKESQKRNRYFQNSEIVDLNQDLMIYYTNYFDGFTEIDIK